MKSEPTSTKKLREMAMETRKMLGLPQSGPIQMPKVYDRASLMIDGFEYESKDDNDPCFQPGDEAYYDIGSKKIYIKESIFQDACNNRCTRSQYTLAHELGHFMPSNVFHLKLCRENRQKKVPCYEDPEWQANTYAAELLMPFDECIRMSPEEISEHFGVSKTCAEVRKAKVMKEVEKEEEQNQ